MSAFQFQALAAALLLSSVAVSAQAEAANDPAAQPAPVHADKNTRDPNTVICKREEEIGSRLGGTKTCRTRAEWEQMSRDSAEAVTNMQVSGSHALNPSGH